MQKPTKKLAIVGGGAAGLLALGLSVPAIAAAADPSPSPSASSSAAPAPSASSSAQDKQKQRADRQAALAAALAKELGIDQAKVADALQKAEASLQAQAKTERQNALKSRLDEAVKAGTLTQAQEDAILKAAEAGVLPYGGPGGPGFGGHGPGR
ncbi:MAG TPA: hypothetical protein VI011_11990 [Asanoa sp.]|jgi:hypothetical protein